MRRTLPLVACLGCLLAGVAAAQDDTASDVIGIYLDQAGTVNCTDYLSPYTLVPLYVVVSNLSEPSGMAGWEAGIFTDPAVLPVPLMLQSPWCDFVCELPFLRVGFAAPLPRAPTMVLATIAVLYMGGPIELLLGACEPTSFPDDPGPGYAAGDDPGRLVRLHQAGTHVDDPQHPDRLIVCTLCVPGWPCTPPTQVGPGDRASTWGTVKQLYD